MLDFWTFFLNASFSNLLSWLVLFNWSMRVCHIYAEIGVSVVMVCDVVGFFMGIKRFQLDLPV